MSKPKVGKTTNAEGIIDPFALVLCKARIDANLTGTQVAEILGVTRQAISQGERHPHQSISLKLVKDMLVLYEKTDLLKDEKFIDDYLGLEAQDNSFLAFIKRRRAIMYFKHEIEEFGETRYMPRQAWIRDDKKPELSRIEKLAKDYDLCVGDISPSPASASEISR